MEDLVHEPLEGLSRVSQSKWHLDKFKESKGHGDGRLRNVLRGHGYLVIGTDQIEFGENGGVL